MWRSWWGLSGVFQAGGGGKRLSELWARLHVATGLGLEAFEALSLDEVELLVREVDARERLAYVPWCDLYALLCNLLGRGKRTWTREDFLPDDEGQEKAPPAEAEAGLRAYAEAVARGRERMRGKVPSDLS